MDNEGESMSDPLPPDRVLVAPIASPSDGAYHTTRCHHVRERHTERSIEWAVRSRLSECSVCSGTADSPEGGTFDSPAHAIRASHKEDSA